MHFQTAPDSRDLTNRLVSEGGLVEIGVWRVMFGWRVRVGFVGAAGCHLDWCGGSEWKDVERLYSLALAIMKQRTEDRRCFVGIPPVSTIKPFYKDPEFLRVVGSLAGDFELVTLQEPVPAW